MDVVSADAGADYRKQISDAIAESSIVLVLIGQKWLSLRDELDRQRLSADNDIVRAEIENALRLERVVFPILIDNAKMPADNQLPDSIRLLATKNALRVKHESFNTDMEKILDAITAHVLPAPKVPITRKATEDTSDSTRAFLAGGLLFISAIYAILYYVVDPKVGMAFGSVFGVVGIYISKMAYGESWSARLVALFGGTILLIVTALNLAFPDGWIRLIYASIIG